MAPSNDTRKAAELAATAVLPHVTRVRTAGSESAFARAAEKVGAVVVEAIEDEGYRM